MKPSRYIFLFYAFLQFWKNGLCFYVSALRYKIGIIFLLVNYVFVYDASRSNVYALQIIKDAQTEKFLSKIAYPLFQAGEIPFDKTRVYVYHSDNINAFVSKSGLFISTGLIINSDTPNELISVLAHELGHLKAGHLVQLQQRIEDAKKQTFSTFLLGLGTALAVGLSGGSGEVISGAGVGILALGSSATRNRFFSYRRHQEGEADIIALQLLEKTKQSGKGLINIFKKLRQKSWHAGVVKNYITTHPTHASRITALQKDVQKSPYFHKKDPPSLSNELQLVQAKLIGFLDKGNLWAHEKFLDLNSDAQKYAEAIYRYILSQRNRSMQIMQGLIEKYPKDAFFHEFYGQMFLESGNVKKSLYHFEKAIKLESQASLIRIIYSKALISIGDKKAFKVAIKHLHRVLHLRPNNPDALFLLSMVYARQNKIGLAELYTAYFKIHTSQKRQAVLHAKKALSLFKKNSTLWLKASDIVKSLQYQ